MRLTRASSFRKGPSHNPQSNHARSRKRRQINNGLGLVAKTVGEAIRKDQPTLASVLITSTVWPERVFRISPVCKPFRWEGFLLRDDPDEMEGQLELSSCLQRAKHRCRARHIVLHSLHPVGWFDGDAPAVKRDPLPYQYKGIETSIAVMFEDDELPGSWLPLATATKAPIPRVSASLTSST